MSLLNFIVTFGKIKFKYAKLFELGKFHGHSWLANVYVLIVYKTSDARVLSINITKGIIFCDLAALSAGTFIVLFFLLLICYLKLARYIQIYFSLC